MNGRLATRTVLISIVAIASACGEGAPGGSTPGDARPAPDAGPDASTTQDATAGPDAQPADAVVFDGGPDAGPVLDGGPIPDGGPGLDGGPIPDGGPGLDGGPIPDGGPGLDGGPLADGGPGLDAGPGFDGGPGVDGGPLADGGFDGGPRPDVGPLFDSGPRPDVGPLFDSGPRPDVGPIFDGGPRPDVGPLFDAGAPGDGGADAGVGDAGTLALTPTSTVVPMGAEARFVVNAPAGQPVEWRVGGVVGGSLAQGLITPEADLRVARYTAPLGSGTPAPGTFVVTANSGGEQAGARIDLAYVAPVISGVAPSTLYSGGGTVTATISGAGFTAETQVYFGGLRLSPRAVRWDRIVVDVAPTLLLFPGSRDIRLVNPPPGGGQALTSVTVVLQDTQVPATVPADVPALFGTAPLGPDPVRAPTITYPEHGSFAPRDFPAPEVSFAAFADHNVCRLDVDGPGVDLEVFAPTTGLTPFENPRARVDGATWGLILAATRGLTVTLQVTCAQVVQVGGFSQLADGFVYTSVPVTYTVEPFAAGGRIVYFSGLIEGLWRIEMGSITPQATPWVGPNAAFQLQTNGCVGCHSLAPDGARMSLTSGVSEFAVLDTLAGSPSITTPLSQPTGAEWTAIHPSARWVVGVTQTGQLALYDANTGAFVMAVPTAATGLSLHTQPFWSPAGDRLAFVASDLMGGGVHDAFDGELWTIPFTQTATAPSFGAPALLVPTGGQNNFYPAFSPDGQWVLFCRAPTGPSYNNPQARLQVIRADGVGGPVDLGLANQTRPNNFNSWPRWAPTVQQGRYWIVYSSQRPYPPLIGTGPQQLWVTRFDPSRLPADPSTPGLWLPGQAPYTGNLTAEWSVSQ